MLLSTELFADANSEYADADFVIFGVPFDKTSCFRKGSKRASSAIREASYNFETYDPHYDVDLCDVAFCDLGDIDGSVSVDEMLKTTRNVVEGILNDGKIPIMMGGEHSLTYPCIQAFHDIGTVVLDAHLDLRDEYEGCKHSHACVSRRIIEVVGAMNYVSIGIRSGAKEEYDFAKENDIHFYTMEQIRSEGIAQIVRDAIEYLNTDQIYLSIDADVIDPAYAPAVGNPEPFGMNPIDIKYVLQSLAPYASGFDLVEISPEYDHGQTALLGAKLIREFIAAKGSV
ncbi:MAG: agmatinase [Methanocellales archaeon]|nr:agmatinase [Methanocellales archaeon]MDD3292244.1 agmatinase [Methanocellales archaeon]MDD5235950.1 agmatinase [Methanocellales archaeon]MDD5484860.1 agmatinase [Methanocellales archaeon]